MAGEPNIGVMLRTMLKEWGADAYLKIVADVKRNLSGRVLKRDSGRLINSIDLISKPTDDGCIIGTNVAYGIAWEQGIRRHTISPAPGRPYAATKEWGRKIRWSGILPAGDPRARLRFMVAGQEVFARSVTIPAQAPRKFLEPAIEMNRNELERNLANRVMRVLNQAFPDKTITINVKT